MDIISAMPNELSLKIFHYLSNDDLRQCCQVNYHWRRIAYDDTLWEKFARQRFQNQIEEAARNGVPFNFPSSGFKIFLDRWEWEHPYSNDRIIDVIEEFLKNIKIGKNSQFICHLDAYNQISTRPIELLVKFHSTFLFDPMPLNYIDCDTIHASNSIIDENEVWEYRNTGLSNIEVCDFRPCDRYSNSREYRYGYETSVELFFRFPTQLYMNSGNNLLQLVHTRLGFQTCAQERKIESLIKKHVNVLHKKVAVKKRNNLKTYLIYLLCAVAICYFVKMMLKSIYIDSSSK